MELLGMVLTIVVLLALAGIVSTGLWLLVYISCRSLFGSKCSCDCKCNDEEERNKS